MKLDCGKKRREQEAERERREDWHEWFAWHPVKLNKDDCRWLETVQRKQIFIWTGKWRVFYNLYRPIS